MNGSFEVRGITFGSGKPVICIPIVEKDAEGILEQARRLAKLQVSMVEWRADCFAQLAEMDAVEAVLRQLREILKDIVLLFSIRTVHQGGNAAIDEKLIIRLNEMAASGGLVDFVDLEFFEASKPIREIARLKKKGVRVIASHHDFEKTPDDRILHMLMDQMYSGGADIAKIAVYPKSREDVLRLMKFTEDTGRHYPDLVVVTMAMGNLGVLSRISGELTGSAITFGTCGAESAPGQIPFEELTQILDILHSRMEEKQA
ncbi:MAG: type I 3-dehydroquinate dehydratase [Eubacterium sp.]|jgi:3-dehydroquinate dehydratase-1